MTPGQRRRRGAKRRRKKQAAGDLEMRVVTDGEPVYPRPPSITEPHRTPTVAALLGAWTNFVGSDRTTGEYVKRLSPPPALGEIVTSPWGGKPGMWLGHNWIYNGPVPAFGAPGYDLHAANPALVAALVAGKVTPPWPIADVVAHAVWDGLVQFGARINLHAWVVLFDHAEAVAPTIGVITVDAHPTRGLVAPMERGTLLLASHVPVQPQEAVRAIARPQMVGPVRIERFVLHSDTASSWQIEDIQIGNRSQFMQAGPIPGDVFATDAPDAFVSFEMVQTAMDIVVTARNVGLVPLPFVSTMISMAPGHGGARVDLTLCESVDDAIDRAPELVRDLLAAQLGRTARPARVGSGG